jgi:hypothetical protein
VSEAPTRITLLDSLSGDLLQFPLAVMRDVGPAVQTLAGLMKETKKETFAAVAKIALRARLPIKTVRNQLDALHDAGWIVNAGRQRTRQGAPRRTCTIRVTTKAIDALSDYTMIPWWACCTIKGIGRLKWGSKALLSVLLARLAAMKAAIEPDSGRETIDPDHFWGNVANYGDEDRFRFALTYLQEQTGLSKHAIIDAKFDLNRLGIISLQGNRLTDGGFAADVLWPRSEFAAVVTPAGEGKCFITFDKGAKS